jgi:hypothetical protein
MDIISDLGLGKVAALVQCKAPSVAEWRKRGIPPGRCADLERLTEGRYTCEAMRPDLRWVRLTDATWPWHPKGRPLLDVAPANAALQVAA